MSDAVKPPPIPRQEPKTIEMPKVEVPQTTANALLTEMRAIRTEMSAMNANWKDVSEWRGEVEGWRSDINQALIRNSVRAKQPSEHDLAAAAELAKERSAREDQARKLDEQAKKLGALMINDIQQNKMLTELGTKLELNNAWTKELIEAGTGFAKAHPQLVAAVIGFAGAFLGWATHWLQGGHP